MDKIIISKREKEAGQASIVFIASLVIIMASFALLVDGGRYLVMRNRVRMMADASALSGASMLDIEEAQKGNFNLDPVMAYHTAEQRFKDNKEDSPEWADFQLVQIQVRGNEIWVTIIGTSTPLFGSNLGLNYTATIVSSARAASGISSER
ncbi:MAG: Tad domain-containing protein [Desulfobacteraceae bacterium]|nr:Tad domain-containing protein [Desulfobacteraceae bacterium]